MLSGPAGWRALVSSYRPTPRAARRQTAIRLFSLLLVVLVCRTPRGPLSPPLPSRLPEMRAGPLCGLRRTISCSIPRESGGSRGGLLFLRRLLTWDSTQGQKPARSGLCLTAEGCPHTPGLRKLHGTQTVPPCVWGRKFCPHRTFNTGFKRKLDADHHLPAPPCFPSLLWGLGEAEASKPSTSQPHDGTRRARAEVCSRGRRTPACSALS